MALQLLPLACSSLLLVLALGGGDVLKLPEPPRGGVSLAEAFQARRSSRAFDPSGPTLAQAAALLWAGQGVNRPDGRRTVPSAGAAFPLDLYLVTEGSKDLPRGTYQYLPKGHRLRHLSDRGVGACFRELALQNWVKSAPALVVVAVADGRSPTRYGERTAHYVSIEAGAAAQSIALQATALGLGSGIAGAFDEQPVGRALGLPADERPLLLMPIGSPRD